MYYEGPRLRREVVEDGQIVRPGCQLGLVRTPGRGEIGRRFLQLLSDRPPGGALGVDRFREMSAICEPSRPAPALSTLCLYRRTCLSVLCISVDSFNPDSSAKSSCTADDELSCRFKRLMLHNLRQQRRSLSRPLGAAA